MPTLAGKKSRWEERMKGEGDDVNALRDLCDCERLTDLTPAVLCFRQTRKGMKLKQKLKGMMLCFQDEGRMRASTSLFFAFTLWTWTEVERSNKKVKKEPEEKEAEEESRGRKSTLTHLYRNTKNTMRQRTDRERKFMMQHRLKGRDDEDSSCKSLLFNFSIWSQMKKKRVKLHTTVSRSFYNQGMKVVGRGSKEDMTSFFFTRDRLLFTASDIKRVKEVLVFRPDIPHFFSLLFLLPRLFLCLLPEAGLQPHTAFLLLAILYPSSFFSCVPSIDCGSTGTRACVFPLPPTTETGEPSERSVK